MVPRQLQRFLYQSSQQTQRGPTLVRISGDFVQRIPGGRTGPCAEIDSVYPVQTPRGEPGNVRGLEKNETGQYQNTNR